MPAHTPHQKAHRHLSRRDDVLKAIIGDVGPCTLIHNPDGFAVLARSIISQQISTKAARRSAAACENAGPLRFASQGGPQIDR